MSKKPSDNQKKATLPKYARDQIIVKLKQDTVRRITSAIPSTPLKYSRTEVSEFGVSAFDKTKKLNSIIFARQKTKL